MRSKTTELHHAGMSGAGHEGVDRDMSTGCARRVFGCSKGLIAIGFICGVLNGGIWGVAVAAILGGSNGAIAMIFGAGVFVLTLAVFALLAGGARTNGGGDK